jgi:hypothetical protein
MLAIELGHRRLEGGTGLDRTDHLGMGGGNRRGRDFREAAASQQGTHQSTDDGPPHHSLPYLRPVVFQSPLASAIIVAKPICIATSVPGLSTSNDSSSAWPRAVEKPEPNVTAGTPSAIGMLESVDPAR